MPLVATRGAASAQGFGEFAQSAAVTYIEDVFSTYLYTGNGSTQTINNGIDLSGKGGLVWIKSRKQTDGSTSPVGEHGLWDTARGAGTSGSVSKALSSNSTAAQNLGWTDADYVSAYNSSGFTVQNASGTTTHRIANHSFQVYASWTFRKQPKFFDVVTWSGDEVSGRQISHALGSVPGCIMVKCLNDTRDWWVYHRSLGATKTLILNDTASQQSYAQAWNNTEPTSTVFTVGNNFAVNGNGGNYVAYLFAHDAGGFGLTGTDNVISCGSYTASGSNGTVTLGYEPQWVLIKNSDGGASGVANWQLIDNMRGMPVGSNDQTLYPNSSGAEASSNRVAPTATGFSLSSASGNLWDNGAQYIYIAIRRGPMKTPTSGTSVFDDVAYTGDGGASRTFTNLNFPPDLIWTKSRSNGTDNLFMDRLRGPNRGLVTNQAGSEGVANGYYVTEYGQLGWTLGTADAQYNLSERTYIAGAFRRAPGFFDEVCYTGTGSNLAVNHNLGVAPEMMIAKSRTATSGESWAVSHIGRGTPWARFNGFLNFNMSFDEYVNWYQNPTATQFFVTSNYSASGISYVSYLFATVAGVSKVGSYTGTGTTQQINCGFTAGARFVLIKRTDSTGDWYVWDSARGIVAGNDPYLLLNSAAAEVTNTDFVDTASTGFEISSTAPAAINANGGTFIFLAIA